MEIQIYQHTWGMGKERKEKEWLRTWRNRWFDSLLVG